MTKIKVNPKKENASDNFNVLHDFSAAFSIRFFHGSPVAYNMEPWDLFGISKEEFEETQRTEAEAIEAAANAAAEAAQAASLGNSENYEQTSETEELKADNAVRERFALMEYLKDVMRPCLPPRSSILKCYKVPCSTSVRYFQGLDDRDNKVAKVEGLCHDHSVHFCPMCSFKIAIGRALQIATITDRAAAEGFGLYHMVLTMRHSKYDSMETLMDEMAEAKKHFWRNGSVCELYKANFQYRIDTLEMMFGFDDENGEGGNGLHEHYHITLIGAPNLNCKELQPKFEKHWIKSLGGKGQDGGVALTLKPWETKELAHYLTKLPTASFEMAMGAHTKHNNGKSDKSDDDKEKKGEHFGFFHVARIAMKYKGLRPLLEPLIRAYYFCTKGKNFIRFSRGLLERFGVKDKTDDELAEDGGRIFQKLAVLSNIDYKKLTHAQIAESRILARRGEKSALWAFFEELGITCHENESELIEEWNGCGEQQRGKNGKTFDSR